MPAYKDDKSNSWFLRFSYKTWDGKYKKHLREALKLKKKPWSGNESF